MTEENITILGEDIPAHSEMKSIHDLKFFEENPRVFSCVFGENKPEDKCDLQAFIEQKMLEQPSVKNLIPDIKRHGGLIEPIVVKYDTLEVIEGNSRLAVFRKLYKEDANQEKWGKIRCIVTKLTSEQQDNYLHQIHVKGKTPWSPYEKANIFYTRNQNGVSVKNIACRFSVTENEVKKQINTIWLMKKNGDTDTSKFSYYDVLVRTRNITGHNNYTPEVKESLISKIKNIGIKESASGDFKAQDLRDKMPTILKKPKELKKFLKGTSSMDNAFQNAKLSGPHNKVRAAKDKISDIGKAEISRLDRPDISALLSDLRRLYKEVNRVKNMAEEIKNDAQ